MRISVFGLGKLGAPMAAVFASGGMSVIGYDMNEEFVRRMDDGLPPVSEPGLAELIAANRGRLRATMNSAEAVRDSDITFIIVPTPSTSDGTFTNKYVLEAIADIGKALRGKSDFHVVVVSSTVMPGSCDGVIRDALEHSSGKKVGEQIGLCYNPEFIALGSVIRDMTHPDFILVGASDKRSGKMLASVHARVCPKNPPVRHMNLVNAEIAKITVNSYVTMKISFANLLGEMCEAIPGGDAAIVAGAIGLDTRIGSKYLKPALGFGGPCFPRDSIAFSAMSRRVGVTADLADSTQKINDRQAVRLAKLVVDSLPVNGKVAVLGLSYKPDTWVIERSQGVELAQRIAQTGAHVAVHDPLAVEPARAVLGSSVEYAETLSMAVACADVIVIATPWKDFQNIHVHVEVDRDVVIFDCWDFTDPTDFVALPRTEIVRIGRHHTRAAPHTYGAASGTG